MPLTASEVAEAYGYMALAGWDYEQQLSGIEGITKSSIAWNTDLATTSDLVTDALSATGKTVDDLTWFLDVATKTQNKANTTATDLMKAWIECGGTASQLGIDIDESDKNITFVSTAIIKKCSNYLTKLKSALDTFKMMVKRNMIDMD